MLDRGSIRYTIMGIMIVSMATLNTILMVREIKRKPQLEQFPLDLKDIRTMMYATPSILGGTWLIFWSIGS